MGLLLLALLHLYIGARLLPPLGHAGWPGALVLVALFGLLWSALRSGFGRRGPPALAWASLAAVGWFSSLLVLTLLRDALLLGAAAACATGAATACADSLAPVTAWAVPAGAVAASALGFINARRLPAVRRVDVPMPGLPPALHGLRIAQITDLHVGPTIRRGFVQAVVDRINALDADLVVLTGDLVDGSVAELRAHTAPLAQLRARHGCFAVTGNHEYYSGAAAWVAEYARLGLQSLQNRHVVIDQGGARFVLAGINDLSAGHFDPSQRSDPARALAGAPADAAPRIVLAHQPRSAEACAQAGFDLQLSGHTHGGQFLPWNLVVPLQQPYTAGLHRHGRLWVYTSRGTGYWGPPKRLGAPSEISLLRLVPAPG